VEDFLWDPTVQLSLLFDTEKAPFAVPVEENAVVNIGLAVGVPVAIVAVLGIVRSCCLFPCFLSSPDYVSWFYRFLSFSWYRQFGASFSVLKPLRMRQNNDSLLHRVNELRHLLLQAQIRRRPLFLLRPTPQ
jgi:hypothetical protein